MLQVLFPEQFEDSHYFSILNRKKAKGLTQPLPIFRNIRPQMGARIASLRREAAAIPQLPCPVTNSVCHTEHSSLHSQVPQPPRGICTSLARICGGGDFIHAFQPWCGERQGFAALTLDQSKAEVVQRGLKHHPQCTLLPCSPMASSFQTHVGLGLWTQTAEVVFFITIIFILMILGALMAADRGCRLRCSIQAPQHF